MVSRREAVGRAWNLDQWSVYSVDVLMPCVVSLSYRDLVGPSCSRESFACPAKQALLIERHDLLLESDKTCLVPTGSQWGLWGRVAGNGQTYSGVLDHPRVRGVGSGGDQAYVHV